MSTGVPTRRRADPIRSDPEGQTVLNSNQNGKTNSNLTTERSSTSQNATTTCERCAQLERLLTEAEAANVEIAEQARTTIAGLEHNLRRAGQAEVALRNELTKLREEEPDAPEIREILEFWRDTCKDGDKRVKIPLTGDRAKAVKKARRVYDRERIENAIRGCALNDWAMGRLAKTQGRQFNDIAKHILNSQDNVEEFEKAYLRSITGTPPPAPVQPQRPARVPSDPLPRLLDRLEHVKEQRPGQWAARCPAHEDRHASLSLARGDRGVVVHCHTGCTSDQIAAAVGIPINEWFNPDDLPASALRPVATQPDPLPTIEQVKAWADRLQAHSKLLARLKELRGWGADALRWLHVGYDGERLTFPIYTPDGNLLNVVRYRPGAQQYKSLALKGHDRGLFPPPELCDPGPVWLVEGEPDAVSARQLGVVGVAVPGTNGWRPAYAARFEGRSVVVCMDCDAPGRKLAQTVAASLAAAGVAVRAVDLAPDRDDKFDLTDFLLAGGTGEQLMAMATLEERAA